ncbi:MAG: hypothetical protein ABEH59_01375 [Halobacteriales archaeon]
MVAMIELRVDDGTIQAVDVGKNEISLSVHDWEHITSSPYLDRDVDKRLAGSVRRIEFPEEAVSVERTDIPNLTLWDGQTGPLVLEDGHYILKIEQRIVVYLAIENTCVLEEPTSNGTVGLDFQRPSPVTLGFRSRIDKARETVTVPANLEGARTAIQCQTAGIDSLTPDKSFPSLRLHPPAIQFGKETSIPEPIRKDIKLSDIDISVPNCIEDLFVIAPLSLYLQAKLTFAEIENVRLRAPTLDAPLSLGHSRTLENDVAALLRRIFFLDCLVRNVGLEPVDLQQTALLEELELDADQLYDESNADRLAAYLQEDFSAISDRLPEWHLSTIVKPDLASLPAIPHLLNRLSLIQPPNPVSMNRDSLIAESISDSHGGMKRKSDVCSGDALVRNRTRLGKQQGWMTSGTPVDSFRATQTAFEAKSQFYEESSGPKRVMIVVNEPAMLEERDSVEQIYLDRSSELDIDVIVKESINRAELRDLFLSKIDFLHFIGHCDDEGLRCSDGWLAAESLEHSSVQTFFLNACDSFNQGLELVQRGSVAGAVTIADILNREATEVGMTFAKLMMHGFSVCRALDIASRRSLRNKFYNVVGDGSHRLSQGLNPFPAELFLENLGNNMYKLQFEFSQLNVAGGLARPRIPNSDYLLRGSETSFKLETHLLTEYLESVQLPVIYENEFHWSTDLADKLKTTINKGSSKEHP